MSYVILAAFIPIGRATSTVPSSLGTANAFPVLFHVFVPARVPFFSAKPTYQFEWPKSNRPIDFAIRGVSFSSKASAQRFKSNRSLVSFDAKFAGTANGGGRYRTEIEPSTDRRLTVDDGSADVDDTVASSKINKAIEDIFNAGKVSGPVDNRIENALISVYSNSR